MQQDFKANRWLGITVSDLLYIDFSGKISIDTAYKELIEQIAKYMQSDASSRAHQRSIIRTIIDYVNSPASSEKSTPPTDAVRPSNLDDSTTSSTATFCNDVPEESFSTTEITPPRKQLKNWNLQ
jgi:hypothetical protein